MAHKNPLIVEPAGPVKLRVKNVSAWYGVHEAVKSVTMEIPERRVTAIIGPSGCGKSTFIRCLNRMHEVIPQ
ncbi:MAG TPA: ATP-binding cassette domain-containing protein, partial [Bdellovibrionota bacterium]|nr:ATP-binding cassette domain-containing protein [Bdellovibrionota bacterium]